MNNRKETAIAMYGLFLLIILDILFLIFAKKIFVIDKVVLYSGFLVFFTICVWRIITLKAFSMEVSEHILSIKYNHPVAHIRKPVLEVPLEKVLFFKIEKGILNHFMIININTKRGMRSFYYRIGKLPKKNAEKLGTMLNFIEDSRMKVEEKF